jgi:Ca2+-binding RTX toxin-like protein
MATLTTYLALNLFSNGVDEGGTATASTTRITVVDGNETGVYYGNFTLSGPYITGGTITGFDSFTNGVLDGRVRGMSVGVIRFGTLLDNGDAQGAYAYAFRGNDTFYGSAFGDRLRGFAGADRLYGEGGKDYLQGDGGNDKLNGGAGNDTLVWDSGDIFNGNSGVDTLRVLSGNADLTSIPDERVRNIERIDLKRGIQILALAESDVLSMSSTAELTILGDGFDTVEIDTPHGAGTDLGNGFTSYTVGGATLIIDSDVQVF